MLGEEWSDFFGIGEEDIPVLESFRERVEFESGDGNERGLIEWPEHQCLSDPSEKFRTQGFFEVGQYGMTDVLESGG